MTKLVTNFLLVTLLCLLSITLIAQTTVTQWHFNSTPPDGSTSTGTTLPSIGSGTITGVGGLSAFSYSSGTSDGGSSDPATTDNSGLSASGWPAQGSGDKTRGLELQFSTLGYQDISLAFDQRNSNTAPAHLQVQYTLDATASTPTWVDFTVLTMTAGSTWLPFSVDFSSIAGLNNNATVGVRLLATFEPSTSAYVASNLGSNYGTGGTWRFDMMTITGTPVSATLPNLVITEVAHSPNTIEFIEVYNAGTTDIDLTGLSWAEGTSGNFPAQILTAGEVVLFSTDPTSASSLMGGTYHLLNNGLGGSDDILVIKDALGNTIDSVQYFDGTNGWPTPPTGFYGYSFTLNDAALDNTDGANWSISQTTIATANGSILASPGQYPPPVAVGPQLVSFSQTSGTVTTIEFDQAMSATTTTNTTNYTFIPAVNITAASLLPDGATVELTHDALIDGQPYELIIGAVTAADNTPNDAADTLSLIWNGLTGQLVITEIIHSPNTIEGLEVYNAGTTTVALGGLQWAEGTNGAFPIMDLAAGAAIYFSTEPATAASELIVPVVYPLGAGLGSSDDVVVIRNTADQTIDSVAYFVGTNGWPSAATGVYGYSFELTDATLDNANGSNWTVPLNVVSPEPAGGVVRATPGVYPAPPVAPGSAAVSFVGVNTSVEEDGVSVDVIANLLGGTDPVTVDLEIIAMGTATAGDDFIAPATMQFSWAAGANNVNDTLSFQIQDDALAESAEYFVVRFTNGVNASLPSSAGNHFTVFIIDNDKMAPAATEDLMLTHLSSFSNGTEGVNSAEIVAHDPVSQRLFIANSIGAKLDIVDFSNPSSLSLISSVAVTPYGNINSVAVKNGIVALAIENANPQANGSVVFMDTLGTFLSQVTVGAMPDMITFNHAGTKVLTANEGEPDTDYTYDPEGSISVIDISGGAATVTQAQVTNITLTSFNSQLATLQAQGVRIFGLNATVAQDLEPEYITISTDDNTAWVSCQENNALLVVDLSTNTVSNILALGTKDHSVAGNGMDANDQTGAIQIANWPVHGVYMPDGIAYFEVSGVEYIISANEGDAREWDAYSEVERLNDAAYLLDTVAFPYPDVIKANLGRLNITFASGDNNGDGYYEEIHSYGGRSVSIWNATTGALVWDSGDDMELMIAQHPVYSALFNASNSNNNFKNRSDDKGPEPEGVLTAIIEGDVYAFIALERMGGCMVYKITNPAAPVFVNYINTRSVASYGGDQGSEGILYIDPTNSPNNEPIIILANEVSSTLSIFGVTPATPTPIKMSTLIAVADGNGNKLTWTTYQENAGDKMIIQRSINGTEFTDLHRMSVKGTAQAYEFVDEQAQAGANHYRIQMANVDGTTAYSNVATVRQKKHSADWSLNLYPNPATDRIAVVVAGQMEQASIEIIDAVGSTVRAQQLHQAQTTINLKGLPAGTYFLKYLDGMHTEIIPFSKH